MLRFAVALFCALIATSARLSVAQPAPAGEIVIPAGQEELLSAMLGRGATLPGGCAFAGGRIDHAAIVGTYKCTDGEVEIELRHPSRAAPGSMRTDRFAIHVRKGSPPPGFFAALESSVRARERAFEWTVLPPPPPPSPTPSPTFAALPIVAALLALAALSLLLLRLAQRLRARHRSQLAAVRDRWFWAGAAVLMASTVLRCWLAIVNDQQNDNHLEVAALITKAGWAAPASAACMECSHPKLYHYALAFAFDRIPARDMMVGNLLNFVAATALLVLLYLFSRDSRGSPPVRILGFAFLAFNAGLVGISSQATNDLFCILFSSLAIFFLDRFLAGRALKHVALATVCAVLAAHSKATGWVIFVSVAAVLCLTTLASRPEVRKKFAVASAAFVLGFFCLVSLANPYRDNILRRGTPFVNDAFDLPQMRQEVPRPPLTWALQSFFTFRFFELLRVPFNEYGSPPPYPLHRESLWSQLYGRTFFLRFDQGIWRNQDPGLLNLGRLSLVLGLLPLAALLLGTGDLLRSIWRGVAERGLGWLAENRSWHHLVHVGAVLAAEIAVLVQYRRLAIMFMWMKAFYLFPAILSFFKLFLDGLGLLWRRYPRLVTVWMLALIAVSIADMGWLIHDLSARALP